MYPSEIELIVDEASPGHFYWLLQKQPEPASRPVVVDYAAGPMPTHSAAMVEGIAALQRRIDAHRPRCDAAPTRLGLGLRLGGREMALQ